MGQLSHLKMEVRGTIIAGKTGSSWDNYPCVKIEVRGTRSSWDNYPE